MIYKTPSWKLKVEQHKHNKTQTQQNTNYLQNTTQKIKDLGT
jgi:hypothetical protein